MLSQIKKHIRLNPYTLAFLAIVIVISAYLLNTTFLDFMELKTIDLRFKSRGELAPGPEVVLAVIDEKSINKEGKWVWPRSKMARLVTKISNKGARVIAFDVGFLEPDKSRIVQAISRIQTKAQTFNIQNTAFKNYLEKLKLHSDNDRLLADAIKNSSARVVLGYFFHMSAAEIKHIDEKEIELQYENSRGSSYKLVHYTSPDAQKIPLLAATAPQANIKILSDATDYSGFFNMLPDQDGVVRSIPAVIKFRELLYAPLSLMALSAYFEKPLLVKLAEFGIQEIRIGSLSIPTDEAGRILVNYRGREKTFAHIPITDILNDNIAVNALKDKIVLIGATAIGIYDLRVTPFGSVFPGVEIHANMIDTVLKKDFLHKPGWVKLIDILTIIIAGLFLGFILARAGVISGIAIALALLVGHVMLCQFLFSEKGVILSLVYPLAVIALAYISITAYRYLAESRQKAFIKDAFSTYLAPSVVKQLMDSPEKLMLGGEDRVITAFFSDVQGFTSISENLSPAELVELLNEFLTEMTDIILKYEGTIDKFEGDAIIAFFGAPQEIENHAEVACQASIDMQIRLAELRTHWKTIGKPELKMRIGLCTGHAVVGNMGSKTRMDYTMMGDTVNTAARLEGVNKVYGNFVLVSDTTYQAAGNGIVWREIDSITVVGKQEPVTIYQPVAYQHDIDEHMTTTIDHYTKGLYSYRKREWNNAILSFTKALGLTPDDGPSKTMLTRCNEYQANPPAKDWNGAYTMTTK